MTRMATRATDSSTEIVRVPVVGGDPIRPEGSARVNDYPKDRAPAPRKSTKCSGCNKNKRTQLVHLPGGKPVILCADCAKAAGAE
jgi:hypothetical protein